MAQPLNYTQNEAMDNMSTHQLFWYYQPAVVLLGAENKDTRDELS